MSFAKYAQFYKDNGFFAGSKIKTTVTDGTFVGEQLVLSKGNTILKTTTIPTSGKVEFFTDESGELLLSADNGTSTLSGSVTITSYATYNVTLHGTASDNKREAYANDVTMDKDTAETTVAYTGDKSSMSIVVSDHKLIKAQIDGEKIKITDGGYDKKGKCSITATIAETENYTSADVTFYVNKLTGTYGDWGTADDEMISSMIAQADAGEIDLADFWNIGDTRRVHLNAIETIGNIGQQPEQDIDLVILHNPIGDSKYRLKENTVGLRYQPNFIIGVKECLQYKTAMGYMNKSYKADATANSRPNFTTTINLYQHTSAANNGEMLTFLNDSFVEALPAYLTTYLKETRRYFADASENLYDIDAGYGYTYGQVNGTYIGIKDVKVSLPNVKEILGQNITVNDYYYSDGSISYATVDAENIKNNVNNRITSMNNCGTYFDYYKDNTPRKKIGLDGDYTDYLVCDVVQIAAIYQGNTVSPDKNSRAAAYYVDSNGQRQNNNLSVEATRTLKRGISPIMFI